MADHLLSTYRQPEVVFTHGSGATLFDAEGKAYLDLLSGIGVNALGHGHPRWSAAVAEQAGRVAHLSNLWQHPGTAPVAAGLVEATGLAGVFFSNSGSEANECALKIARKHQQLAGAPERTGFVALNGGFHGRTFGSLSVTATAAYREPFGPGLPATYVDPEDLDALEDALASSPAALILEPVQGEGGLRELSTDYLRAARERCDATGTLLIADEVQSGCGRTGTFLAIQAAGVLPDIATLAKPLAAGLPIGATLVAAPLKDVLQPGDHGSTFGGGPMALAGARVFLEELAGGLQGQVSERAAQLTEGLDALVAAGMAEGRRGRGLMQGLVLPGAAASVQGALFEQGILCGTATADVLRFLPPFVITADELEVALGKLGELLPEMEMTS